jgi:DNA-3-methyladenine glycosylase I
MPVRCPWAGDDPDYILYHDTEWGVPVHDSRALFEALILDGAQAGLSWITILKRRENYRRAFEGFDPVAIARYGERDIARLLADPGIIRNRGKIESAVANARVFLDIEAKTGDFGEYLWGFVDGRTQKNSWRRIEDVPASTPESKAMAKDLKTRGMRFVGPTICYALMQAVGMVNDHLTECFRHGEV